MTSLALMSRPDLLAKALFVLPLAAVGASFFVQYGLRVDPCSLCIVQRLAYIGCLVFGAAAFALRERPKAFRAATAMVLLLAVGALLVASYQVWLQAFPPAFASCSAGFSMLLDDTPLERAWHFVMDAPGDCREVTLRIAGLTMPQASLVASAVLAAVAARALRVATLRS